MKEFIVGPTGAAMSIETFKRPIRYDFVAMSLHWVIAGLMIFMLFFGGDLMNRRQPDTFNSSLHASIGAAILLLSLARLLWRLRSLPPPLPSAMKPWEIYLSKLTHVLFYVMMIGLPLTGWLAFSDMMVKHSAFLGTQFFGLIDVTQFPGVVGYHFDGLHSLGSNLMIGLTGLHVLAALKHQFIDNDGLLRRMIPF
jgi:cytochrome b561